VSVQEAAVSLLQRVLFYSGSTGRRNTRVCVLDPTGRIRPSSRSGTPRRFADLLRRLPGCPVTRPRCGRIERPDGRLRRCVVGAATRSSRHPNAIKTWRDGEVLSGAKSDAGDAAVIAEYLRLRATGCSRHPVHRGNQGAAHRGPHPGGHRGHAGRRDQQLSALLDAHWPARK